MRLPIEEFLDVACGWAFEHGKLFVEDEALLPLLAGRGINGPIIARCKEELERRGAVRNHAVLGGVRDFHLSRPAFLSYARQRLPPETLRRARELFNTWQMSPKQGPFSASMLAKELGIPERHGSYLLELLK